MSGASNVATLFRVRKTVISMLRNRGYIVTDTDRNLDIEGFKERFGQPVQKTLMTILVQKIDDPTQKLFVFFPDDEKVGVKPIRTYVERMKNEKVKRAIIVVQEGMTAFAKQALGELQPRFLCEHFTESELLVDITEHELVPEHRVLSSEEKDSLLKRYKLKDTQLPRMQTGDPIARYFGLQRGQVVKIIRSSETAGRYVTYRIVL